MRKRTSVNYFVAIGLLLGSILSTLPLGQAAAAACSIPSTTYGSATMKISVPSQGTYRLWTRMQAPDTTNNAVMMEIDGNVCYTVGNTVIPANAWTWVSHQNGSASNIVTASLSAGTHDLKLIGIEQNVKVDRILAVADQACVPSNFGENCMITSDDTLPSVSLTAPAAGATVGGSVAVKATASDNVGVSKVEFLVQNQVVNTDTTSPYEYAWDTANLNGTYTIAAKAYDAVGNSSIDSRAVVVRNGDTVSPSAPGGLAASDIQHNTVTLNWGASTDNGGVKGYRVVRDNVTIATVSTTSYTDTSVVSGTTYRYSIVTFDNSNNVSPASNIVTITTPIPTAADTLAPASPTELTATTVAKRQINLAWKASTDNIGVKEYHIYRAVDGSDAAKIAATPTNSYGDGSLFVGTTYRYYVVAVDAAGNASPASATVSATTLAPSDDSKGTSALRGVVSGRWGRPVSGATVKIRFDGNTYQATTNWRGRYVISDVPSGRYRVHVSSHGHRDRVHDVRLRADKTTWKYIRIQRHWR